MDTNFNRWGIDQYTFAPVAEIQPPAKVGDRVTLLLGWWKIRQSIITEITRWDPKTFEFAFESRPVTKADGRGTREQRKFVRTMRIGSARRKIRERARRLVGLPNPGWDD